MAIGIENNKLVELLEESEQLKKILRKSRSSSRD